MDVKTAKNAYGNVGKETPSTKNQNNDNVLLKDVKKKFGAWWLSLGISILPLLTIPLVNLLLTNSSGDFWNFLIGSSEIIFLGVSIAFIALNDYKCFDKHNGHLHTLNFYLIIAGVFIYTITSTCGLVAEYYKADYNFEVAKWINVIYLVVIILLSIAEYIHQIMEAKK